ncbi:hypothetical protein [Arthrobacter castelli]|uniref:hypothetical protein n=1 Tax=Arthrobacter castelli TaxID=271431 RepID=UPI000418CA5C|nr:hypothetical protein [Arthrobacter castelli]
MIITVTNQQPAVLDAVHTISAQGDYNPLPAITDTILDPLQTPLAAGTTAAIVDSRGNDLSADLEPMLMNCLGQSVDPAAEQLMKELLGQTLVNFDQNTSLPVNELFAAQAGSKHKMHDPDPHKVIYSPKDDVIPAAKALLSGSGASDEFFATLAYTYHPDTLGFWFQSSSEFENFTTWLNTQLQAMSSALPSDTAKLLSDFTNLSLKDLTESLQLRADDDDNNDELSFARLIINMLMTYLDQQRTQGQTGGEVVGIMPFTVTELFCPRSLVLVNAEAHARATSAKIAAEWKVINQSLAAPVKVVSHRNLSKLTALQRAATRSQAAGNAALSGAKKNGRSAQISFRKQPPSKLDLFAVLTRVLARMGKVNHSQNIFRKSKTTFLKANRRDPDDYNKPGRITSVSYMPDLHIYIDTSGSISENNYQEAVMMLVRLAKKLGVNLYFNSFSHILSQETLLKVENKSVGRIWQEFRKIPKVNGMTDYQQIWDYINASTTRKRRLSLVITDFEWNPPSSREEHPKNLYYAPCSAMDWDSMVGNAKSFHDRMRHIEPAIAQRLLGVVV